ncbi:v-SNARE [Yamadazyma tenuis]|uniref:t-SNARE coiled-coil homology domain-containing protein n=1 Tax=Candida tenuis (strain ATCC 10573 / BCRC 21748 / CBS 615 / JCM 9827 / NBRC 10315 / NRRL Y-1498 / VKM Y-70) TaxID=590646 RepID=G3B078_CANTC|nr:uncharacterized protein CANTEDRAFT_97252 [Yamadazyma tenuis ATCC 10573]EGV65340.1 hypothetical protein CANTEDRAFT_97252 [Yamadazyma tenuis ATCC 10573]WEJ95005.1 v-SNARE [Yamadazyma tenuis]
MSDNLYSHREGQNNQRFDELASTLRQFRNTVDDIQSNVQQENSMLNLLNDNFGRMMLSVKRTSGELRTVMNRNSSLTKTVGVILIFFFVVWMLYKLR